jgi:hypothetical protein
MSDNKKAGTYYEQLFICECLSKGIDVSVPIGDYNQYDAILDTGEELLRVQVKGTASKRKDRSNGFSITTGMGRQTSKKTRYSDGAYDILAALVISNDSSYWYIIPKSHVGTNLTLKLFPYPNSKGRWEKYRQAWDFICK